LPVSVLNPDFKRSEPKTDELGSLKGKRHVLKIMVKPSWMPIARRSFTTPKRRDSRRLCITPEDACARDIRSQWRRMTLSLVATPIDPDVPTAERSPIGIIGLLRAIVSDLRTPAENPVAGDFRLRIWLPRQDISSSQRNWHSS
jgi:hypothetical protein